MPQFPIIKYSQTVSNALHAMPGPLTPPQQQSPSSNKPPAKIEESLLLELAIIGVTLLIFFRGFGVILAIAYACYRFYQSIKSHPKRLKIYEEQHRPQLVSQPVARVIHTADMIQQFRQELLCRAFQQTVTYNSSVARKGRKGFSEDKFKKHLVKYFGKSIFTELQVKQPYSDRPYEPDFAYIDHQLGLHIDIEIDEPYVYKSLQPTHYRDFYHDNDRDNVFNGKGRVVIRFSEEQVVRQPDECCKLIAQEIYHLTNQLFFLDKFYSIGNLTSVPKWTEAEAEDMARKQYRDTY